MLDHRHVSREFAEFLHQRTDGIPLAVEELVRLMYDRADLAQRGGEWVRRSLREIAVPATIRDGVLERTRRLSADARAILDAAAVLADPAAEETLGAVAGLDPGRSGLALAEVLRCGLLAEDGRGAVSFRHVLAAQAVYEATSPPQRRQLYLRAARALEGQSCPPVGQLTRHYRKANEPAKWCYYAEQAADLALAAGDEATAGALLLDMLTEADLSTGSVIRLIKKMPFASLTGQAPFRNLVSRLRDVLDGGVPEPAQEAEVHLLLGRVLLMVEDREAARDELERAIPRLPRGSVEAARAAGLLGWPTDATSSVATHRQWLDRAAKDTATLPPADRLNLTVQRAGALLMLGEEAGWAVAAEIPDVASSPGEWQHVVKGHMNVGNMAMAWWGRHEEARRRLTKALELAEAHGYLIFRDMILVTLAHLDLLAGAWDGLAERASALSGNHDVHPLTRHEAILVRGLLYAAAGDGAQAGEALRPVLAEARERALDQCMEPAAALARLRLADGDAEDALRITEEPIAILARKGIWIWATDIVPARIEALIAAGRAGEAGELAGAFARGLGRRDAPAPQAALLLCRALVASGRAQHTRAAALFARAADAWQVPPRPYDALLARERQARSLLAAGRSATGLTILSDVLKGLSGLGARGDAVRVIRTLNEHGVQARRPWLGGRRGYGGQLSPREADVVRLLLGGRTNRQIAEVLFLSPKTVACHVYSAMRKLGVSSRAALVARALDAGFAADSQPAAEAG
jgi:DNA-binding CsgD family transcriptional regulator/tetratricopeptide (TPR) repeat protein